MSSANVRAFSRFLPAVLAASSLVAALSACATDEPTANEEDYLTPVDQNLNLTGRGKDEAIAGFAAGEVMVDITQPELLTKLEGLGYHAAQLFNVTGRQSNDALHLRSTSYQSLVSSLKEDLDKSAPASQFVVTAKDDIPRRFDLRWLSSRHATFDLAGIVFRPDKASESDGTCGEARFIHHLRYAKAVGGGRIAGSRLPFMLNAVYDIPRDQDGSCRQAFAKWRATASMGSEVGAIAALSKGALALDNLRFKQLEVNAQMVRMTSASRPTTGGHAEYFLRVFKRQGNALVAAALENTPDVAALRANPALRAELLAWVKENLADIDKGTALVPTKFLTTRGTSFTTLGSAKLANKPYSQLFSRSDLQSLSFAGTEVVASPEALIARLDDMTCAGCHQGRSVAGFHFLGIERGRLSHPLNALHTAFSPHYRAEAVRRKALAEASLNGKVLPYVHALSAAPAPGANATMGTECVPDASRALFRPGALWNCEPNRVCKVALTNDKSPLNMGLCLPPNRIGENDIAGLPCFGGEIVDDANNPRNDRLQNPPDPVSCGARTNCAKPERGSPSGMCLHTQCTTLGKQLVPGEVCGYGGSSFDQCAAKGDFGACIADSVKIQGRTACDDNNPCREDYVCQRLEDVNASSYSTSPSSKIGYCTPIYFVFQMRLDGHISPE